MNALKRETCMVLPLMSLMEQRDGPSGGDKELEEEVANDEGRVAQVEAAETGISASASLAEETAR